MTTGIPVSSSEGYRNRLKDLFNKRRGYQSDENAVPASKELIASWEPQICKQIITEYFV